jgi:hypothetical protein
MASKRVVYLEPFSGISGDMMVGALLDCGLAADRLVRDLGRLSLEGYRITASRCSRAGIQATRFDVQVEPDPHHGQHGHHDQSGQSPGHEARNFCEIRGMIESSGLSDWVKGKSIEAFLRLAVAEGKIHNQPPDEVHFHEVGAVDSIVDIVGCMIAMEELLPARIVSGPVNVGHGTLECRHGIYPVPGPAAQELLRGIPTYSNSVGGELTTPTGATLVAVLAESFGPRPLMRISATGYGAGARDVPGSANVLRITVGEESESEERERGDEEVAVIEATIDDMNPQVYGYFQERILAEGALDVFVTPVQMKKNRPGHLVTVLCAPERLDAMVGVIFAETTTIGLRHTLARRRTLERELLPVETEFGTVRVKVSSQAGRPMNVAPEFEDCRRVAAEKKVPLKDVLAAAARAFRGDRTR